MISKTCYFCENLMGKHAKCQKHWKKSSFADSHSVIACKDDFTPNADWLYIEALEKENEELKKENSRWKMIQKEKKILIQIKGEAYTANNPFYNEEVKE